MITKSSTAVNFIDTEFNLVDEEEWGTFQEWEAKSKLKLGGVNCTYAILNRDKYSFFGDNGVIMSIPNTIEAQNFKVTYTSED